MTGDPARPAPRWRVRLLALLLPLAGLVGADAGLRALGWLPPDSPLLFHARGFERGFSPFVETAPGVLAIRPDWADRGTRLRRTEGARAGRYFLYPGFRPVQLTRDKPPGARRVFVLGGSTTFGLYVGADGAFAAILAERLRQLAGGRPVEVVNLGCPGWDSERVANLLGAVLALDPDLVIIYTGHNEMLQGEVGTGARLGGFARLRARLFSLSALFAWLDHGLSSLLDSDESAFVAEEVAALSAGRTPTFTPALLPEAERRLPSEAFYREAEVRYGANVRAMLGMAAQAGVPLLFVMPVTNLMLPPRFAGHADGFNQEEEFRAALERARRSGVRDPQAALAELDRAARLSPRNALVPYLRGRLLLQRGRREQARAELRRAADLDGQTQRMTSGLEAELVASVEAAGGAWVDPRPRFAEALDPQAARALFFDHVHPTRRGHEFIAEAVLPRAAALLGLAPAS